MKNIIVYLALLFCFNSSVVLANNEEGIQFLPEETSFREILERAKAENKIIFLDAYTVWCGPCKWMTENVFPIPKVGDFFNKNFINAKINMEKGEGIELAKKYGINEYPTLLFIDGNGEIVHRTCKATSSEPLLELGRTALDNERNLKSFVNKYENGTKDFYFLYEFLTLGTSACMKMDEIAAEYWSVMDKKQWASEKSWKIFETYVRDIESEQFQYLVNNFEEFRTSEERAAEVDSYAQRILYFALARAINNDDNELLASHKEKIAQIDLDPARKALIFAGFVEYSKAEDWINYFAEAEKYIEHFGFDKPETVNDFSWEIYQNVEDKELLAKAAIWMGKMLREEENPNFLYADTHAALLNKSGNTEEGKKAADKAVELAKNQSVNYEEEREIREEKAELDRDLEKIGREIDQATKEGNQDKADELQEVRQQKISEYNVKVSAIKEKKKQRSENKK